MYIFQRFAVLLCRVAPYNNIRIVYEAERQRVAGGPLEGLQKLGNEEEKQNGREGGALRNI